uniref:Secreted protein n=1 Tax=Timema tahoe TaxID=61484 RepID=A0A7R9IM58_9NEOP|nr:unnamed protein product [Timema tahoe]
MLVPRLSCSELLSLLCLTHVTPPPVPQEYKRRSKDMETETEDDLLLFPGSLDAASSGSLSSSVSLSDKSVSTDNNVEEFLGDVPFAGVTSSSSALGPRVVLLGLVPSMCASVAQDDDASMRSCAKRERGVRWSSRSVTSAWTSRLSARGHRQSHI